MSPPAKDDLRTSANKAYAMGDLEKALTLYTKCAKLEPSSAPVRSNTSATLYELGRYEESLVITKEAIKLEEEAGSDRSPALAAKLALRQVKLLIQLRRHDEAVELSDDYYLHGHDCSASALSAPPADDIDVGVWQRFDLQVTRNDPISCVIGGVGDGRHALATIFDTVGKFAAAEAAGVEPKQPHIMLVDILPAAVARVFVLLSLLYDMGFNPDHDEKRALCAVIHYFFFAAIMPPSVRTDLDSALRRARSRLSGSLSSKPPSTEPWTSSSTLPPWLHLDPRHHDDIKAVLDYWLDPAATPRSLVGAGIDRTRPLTSVNHGLEDLEREQFSVYKRIKVLMPSVYTLARESKSLSEPLARFMESPNEKDAKAYEDFNDPFRVVSLVTGNLCNYLPPEEERRAVFDRLHDWSDHMFAYAGAMLNAYPKAFKFELVLGDVFTVLESPREGRDPTFPTTWDHIWLSNICEYVGGPTLPFAMSGALKPLSTSFIAFYIMSSAMQYPSPRGPQSIPINATTLTSLGIELDKLPSHFGLEYIPSKAEIWEYALFAPTTSTSNSHLSNPLRLSKGDLTNFIHTSFLRIALPARSMASARPDVIRPPPNLTSFFRILRRLYEAGHSAHHITEALAMILANTLVTPTRPASTLPTLKPAALSPRVAISTAPFLPELIVAASIYHHSLPFPIPSPSLVSLADIGRYRVELRYSAAGFAANHSAAQTIALMFTLHPHKIDSVKSPVNALDVKERVLRGGECANNLIIHGSFTQSFPGTAWSADRREVTFAMPKETVAKLCREGWHVKMIDVCSLEITAEEIVCSERTMEYLGSLDEETAA
ncbi:hypothetical protein RQP46_009894 [Phenoliferia psychrophenolica]